MPELMPTHVPPPDQMYLILPNGDEVPVREYELSLIHQERARSDRAVVPDMDWSYTDPDGHEHRFVTPDAPDTAQTALWLPTLVKEQRHIDCDGSCFEITHGDCDGYDVPVWFCRTCRAEVEPGVLPDLTAQEPGILIYSEWEWKFRIAPPPGVPEELPAGVVLRTIKHEPGEPEKQIDKEPFWSPLYRGEVTFGAGEDSAVYSVTEMVSAPRRPARL